VPLLADFAVRLAFGLVASLAMTPWRAVPVRFFRIQCQIALGVLVLAILSSSNHRDAAFWVLVAAAAGSYFASVSWGLGLPRIAIGVDLVILMTTGGWLVLASDGPIPAAGRLTSGLLLGATLHAMLLGHYYLTAPAMSIAPLTRALDAIAAALVVRVLLAAIGGAGSAPTGPSGDVAMLAMRWGMGVIGAGVSVYLARRTAAIRSTQSATGILYITTIFVLFGELAAMAAGDGRR
jgi:hypothetical protein